MKFDEFRNNYVILKIRMFRAYSHMQVPFTLTSLALTLSVWFKLFVISSWWIIPIMILIALVMYLIGYIDMKYGFFESELKVGNDHNKAIQELLKR